MLNVVIGHRIPNNILWKKIPKINVPRVEKVKYETASSVDPDFARLSLIHPDIYTSSPVCSISKNYP